MYQTLLRWRFKKYRRLSNLVSNTLGHLCVIKHMPLMSRKPRSQERLPLALVCSSQGQLSPQLCPRPDSPLVHPFKKTNPTFNLTLWCIGGGLERLKGLEDVGSPYISHEELGPSSDSCNPKSSAQSSGLQPGIFRFII